MTADTRRRSPLGHRAAELAANPTGVGLREVPFLTQLDLRVDPVGPAAGAVAQLLGAPLPTEPNTAVRSGELTTMWLGPDEFLVVAPADPTDVRATGFATALGTDLLHAVEGENGAVVDVSAHRTTIELSGDRVLDVLAKGCSLDLHPSVFTVGRCEQVLLGLAPVLLLARGGERPAYLLLVRSSFATYVADWLLDASLEYAGSDD
ncbi:sarcosine oxidase subunit gamma [Lapillicoccus sp.]|uniref:sarcosine oxidase subunit gamma n=1 Tax=Lapillicoccus sp. TaxID=1909287 RepID=UPI003982FB65